MCICYEDIYILGLSVCEKSIHCDVAKIINNSKSTNSTAPIISPVEGNLISVVNEILDVAKSLKQENKHLKEKLLILEERIEIQYSFIQSNIIVLNQSKPNLLQQTKHTEVRQKKNYTCPN